MGCAATALVGLALLFLPLGEGLTVLSYDLPFAFRSDLVVTNPIIVWVDRASLDSLGQTDWPPNRHVWAQLLTRLKLEGARLVFFDIVFRTQRPGEDEDFSAAIKAHGNVVLGALYNVSKQQTGGNVGAAIGQVQKPNELLTAAATNWGLLTLRPLDYSFQARRIFLGLDDWDAAILVAARLSGATVSRQQDEGRGERWLNFYGPAGAIDSVFLIQALHPEGLPRGFFQGKTVFVGPDKSVATTMRERDVFASPYTRFGRPGERGFLSGTEMLATGYLNLVRGDWLARLSTASQAALIVIWAVLASLAFLCFRPRNALWVGLPAMGVISAAACYTQWQYHLWWAWTIPAFVQTPLALGWAMAANRWFPWPPVAFISYRRMEGEGSGYAQGIWHALDQRGCASIWDVEAGLTTKPFRPQLFQLIESVPNFILILSRDSLKPERIHNEDDVFRAEIRHALASGRNIISVLIDDYKLPPATDLPPDIQKIPESHALTRRSENPSLAIEEIIANLRPRRSFVWLRRKQERRMNS